MSRVQLALRVPDLEASLAFYSRLFGTEPAKLRESYANFAIAEPALKLVLIEGAEDGETLMDHLGVEVETTEAVHAATAPGAHASRDHGMRGGDQNSAGRPSGRRWRVRRSIADQASAAVGRAFGFRRG
jgi:catechol 2,3-dioxygenase-like lactoylglutathione lyase family enzyme